MRALTEAAGLDDKGIKQLLSCFSACRMPGGAPRFETTLDAVAEATGEEGLRLVLRDLIEIEPNALHYFFARHLAAGGTHVTANIDTGIERAWDGLQRPVSPRPQVLHFHGSAHHEGELRSLGITLSNVEQGFSGDMAERLLAAIAGPSTRSLIVVGYSGSDYFDVTPFLRSLANGRMLTGLGVLWLDFDGTDPELRLSETHLEGPARATVDLLRAAGASVDVLRGSVRAALTGLGRHWRLRTAELDEPIPERVPTQPSVLSPASQRVVRLHLFSRLGYLPGLQTEFWSPETVTANPGIFAAAAWSFGRYQAAVELWSIAFPATDDGDMLRVERQIACDWVSGRYRKALRLLRITLERSDVHNIEISTRAVLADTGIRLREHALRFPDARWLVPAALERTLAAWLPSEDELREACSSPDLVDRCESARRKLHPERSAPTETRDFLDRATTRNLETSSIVRALNYRQGLVRHLQEVEPQGSPADREILDLWRCWTELQAHGEAVRLLSVPGATHAVGLCAALAYLSRSSVDYPRYHRLRLCVVTFGSHLKESVARWRRRKMEDGW